MLRDYSNQEKKYIFNSLDEEKRKLWCDAMHFDAEEFNNDRFDGVDDDNVDYEMLNDAKRELNDVIKREGHTKELGDLQTALYYIYINAYYRKYPLTEEQDYWCPVCGKKRYHEFLWESLCPECGWEDESDQLEDYDYKGGANKLSVNEAKKLYEEKMAKEADI